jgi:hypothetical protein
MIFQFGIDFKSHLEAGNNIHGPIAYAGSYDDGVSFSAFYADYEHKVSA